ncbi:PH domain-containing protein [Streptomyces lunaelactis]|uniref:PH domain-containing protein n=1 Tax=Streptomyces lunaelactis TaxID=1535768 RepID=UPI00158539DD|nr:PH domain-containing protein [Streptomyces lunaelactis]NUK34996.1 PH domain-containing protein [Streptomyces lunaelactis]
MAGEGGGTAGVRLRPPDNRLSERVVGWWRVQCLLPTAVPVTVLAVLGALIAPARPWLLTIAGVLAVLGLAGTAFFPAWWFRVHRWEVTDEAVYVRTGALWQEWRIAPMSRIQTVDTLRGPLEQAFRLATVIVTTASSKGAIKIEGLDHELAAELAERLTRITQATPGDAT